MNLNRTTNSAQCIRKRAIRHDMNFTYFRLRFFFNFIFLLTFSFDLSEIAQPVAKINIYTQKKNIFMFFSV